MERTEKMGDRRMGGGGMAPSKREREQVRERKRGEIPIIE